jgi:hypothetical protein
VSEGLSVLQLLYNGAVESEVANVQLARHTLRTATIPGMRNLTAEYLREIESSF